MDLNLQMTNRTKVLIGILGILLIFAVATQWGPGLYKTISNPDLETKRKTLESTKALVAASEILKPVENSLYQKIGLANGEQTDNIFADKFPNTVVREKIHGIIREAGIPKNYQLNMEPVPGKKSERISTKARRNLVVLLYQQKLENERDNLKNEIEAAIQQETNIEEESMDMLMNAWLGEEDDAENSKNSDHTEQEQEIENNNNEMVDEKKSEKTDETEDEIYNNQNDDDTLNEETAEWEFVSLPDSIPSSIKIEIIELILSLVDQLLVGADTELFEKRHFYKTPTETSSGFFGIGAKKPATEVNFLPNSDILTKLTNLINTDTEELNADQLTTDLLQYLEQIQSQITDLSQKLELAPTSYTPDSFTVKIKFKAEIDKLVKLNRLIETKTKWLMVRDLQVSADKDNKINVDVLMIARVYQ